MNVPRSGCLFEWEGLKDSPSVRMIDRILRAIPDGELLGSLRRHRGRGRDDYPVHVLWGTLVLKIVLRHVYMEDCLAELRRNRDLRELLGIESESGVPKKWNMTRFLETLGREPHLSLVRAAFGRMVSSLSEVVSDLGEEVSGDGTHLSARAVRGKGVRGSDLPRPRGGRKEYRDADGTVTKVVEWYGYMLYTLIDVRHEVVLAWRVASANADETEEVKPLVGEAKSRLPANRIATLAYDQAADDVDVHRFLKREGIRPVIRNRALWQGEAERMLPGHDGQSNVVYDETGTVYCYDKVSPSPIRRRMSYVGYEKSRGTLKYRCPARHEGFRCRSDSRCNEGKRYGKTLRVKCEIDLRRFPPLPRSTKQFERLYAHRSASERVQGRLKLFWGIDDANTCGAERFHAEVGSIMLVHLAFAHVLGAKSGGKGVLCKTRLAELQKPQASPKKRKMHTPR